MTHDQIFGLLFTLWLALLVGATALRLHRQNQRWKRIAADRRKGWGLE